MSIAKRVQQLEQQHSIKDNYLHVARFIVEPKVEVRGYVCDGITILREPGESEDDLQMRARQSVNWPPSNCAKVFDCLG